MAKTCWLLPRDKLMCVSLQTAQSQSRLPPSMLFSDRDFGADDYEALLALDEGIDNRKGALTFLPRLPAVALKSDAC